MLLQGGPTLQARASHQDLWKRERDPGQRSRSTTTDLVSDNSRPHQLPQAGRPTAYVACGLRKAEHSRLGTFVEMYSAVNVRLQSCSPYLEQATSGNSQRIGGPVSSYWASPRINQHARPPS
jgi:hypothetical protein